MSFFSRGVKDEKFGVIIDIGSGSALAAIVHSNDKEPSPTIVWFTREHAPLKNIESTTESAKAVTTALMNALLKLDGEGRKVLEQYKSGAQITDIQCTISAPWSYTVTKNINYSQEEDFAITEELIRELTKTAQEKTTEEMEESESVSELDLLVVAQTTMALLANGYRIHAPAAGKTAELSLTHASVVTQQYLVDSLQDLRHKLFPEAELKMLSYILTLFCVSKDLYPHLNEACIVDITYEASEIGITREGVLRFSTHTPFGLFSLAREIAEITKVPLHEAFKYFHGEKPYLFIDTLSEAKRAEIEQMFDAYITRLSQLFHETGDELSIPKQMIVNAPAGTETLMKDLLEKAAKRATKTTPAIMMVTEKLQAKREGEASAPATDASMLVAARFFHKRQHCLTFDYL